MMSASGKFHFINLVYPLLFFQVFDDLGFLPATPPVQFQPTSSSSASQVEDGAKFSRRKYQGTITDTP